VEEEVNCIECGAPENACEARYHECLAREFEDTSYGAVHHLTVATYMLQHSNKLTKEGWLRERELLREFLVENKPPAFVRKQNRDVVDNGQRKFKITSKDGQPKISRAHWTKTVLDVRMENAETYCADVNAWAKSALEDTKDLEV
jgi:hypothetical protein